MSEREPTTDDAELNPNRYRGEMKTVGTIEEMLANFQRYKGNKMEVLEESAVTAIGGPVAEADD